MAQANYQSFSRQHKLIKTDEFSSVFDFKRRLRGQFIDLYYKPTQLANCRVGFVVSKKLEKSSVKRNYMRRAIRELFRSHDAKLALSYDIVIRVKKKFNRQDFKDLVVDYDRLMSKLATR